MKSNQYSENILSKENIHLATPDDFDELIRFVLALPEIEEKEYNVDFKSVVLNISEALASTPGFILKNDIGEIVGCAINDERDLVWWNSEIYLANLLTFLEPHYRNSNNFNLLLETCEEYAKMNGMKFVFGLVETNKTDVKTKLLERKGYTLMGVSLVAP